MRSSGKSVISQGFVNVPVKLHTAISSSTSVKFNLVNPKTKNRVRQQYVDAYTNEPLSYSELVRGYEVAEDQFVLFDKEEIKKINSHLDGRISVHNYIPESEVNPLYITKTYFLSCDPLNSKAYALFNQALTELNKVAICTFKSRGKEHLAYMRPHKNILILQLLQYAEYVKNPEEVPIRESDYTEEELHLTKELIKMTSKDEFNHNSYTDESSEKIMELVNHKILNEEIPEPHYGEVAHDLITSLLASLKELQE